MATSKIDKYIAAQKKILAKLRKERDAAYRNYTTVDKVYDRIDRRYMDALDRAVAKITEAKGIVYREGKKLLGQED